MMHVYCGCRGKKMMMMMWMRRVRYVQLEPEGPCYITIHVAENEKDEHVRKCGNPVYPVVMFWDYKEQSLH